MLELTLLFVISYVWDDCAFIEIINFPCGRFNDRACVHGRVRYSYMPHSRESKANEKLIKRRMA